MINSLETHAAEMRQVVENDLREVVATFGSAESEVYTMMAYHLGWEGTGAGVEAQGKRIRPLLVLLATEASGGDWHAAVPAASAVELLHNFSLIHDDIQDQSHLRRGRPTIWVRWGLPQAINTGDVMFTLAHLALLRLRGMLSAELTLKAAHTLHLACLELTRGQYLDLAFEQRSNLTEQNYWSMIAGKTAALLGCCAELGALAAGAQPEQRIHFRRFGHSLGLAFQVLDDWLGIWGDAALTGKSTESDLVSGKKTLPVLYALEHSDRFAARWMAGPITAAEVSGVANLLASEGARAYAENEADRLTTEALAALERATADNPTRAQPLRGLAVELLKRRR